MHFPCWVCKGTGRRHEPMMGDVGRCLSCEGTGRTYVKFVTCPTCKGEGLENFISYVDECRKCKGKKYVEEEPAAARAMPIPAKKKRSK